MRQFSRSPCARSALICRVFPQDHGRPCEAASSRAQRRDELSGGRAERPERVIAKVAGVASWRFRPRDQGAEREKKVRFHWGGNGLVNYYVD